MNQKKIDELIYGTYELLYASSEPSVSFKKLMEDSPKDKRGQIHIPYNDYLIEQKVMEDIINAQIKKYKLKDAEIRAFKFTIYLGCSPKFKTK